jgi:hypothetical protein
VDDAGAAVTGHPHAVTIEATVQFTAAAVLFEEGVERGE